MTMQPTTLAIMTFVVFLLSLESPVMITISAAAAALPSLLLLPLLLLAAAVAAATKTKTTSAAAAVVVVFALPSLLPVVMTTPTHQREYDDIDDGDG